MPISNEPLEVEIPNFSPPPSPQQSCSSDNDSNTLQIDTNPSRLILLHQKLQLIAGKLDEFWENPDNEKIERLEKNINSALSIVEISKTGPVNKKSDKQKRFKVFNLD